MSPFRHGFKAQHNVHSQLPNHHCRGARTDDPLQRAASEHRAPGAWVSAFNELVMSEPSLSPPLFTDFSLEPRRPILNPISSYRLFAAGGEAHC